MDEFFMSQTLETSPEIQESQSEYPIHADQVAAAESLIGLSFTDSERVLLLEDASKHLEAYDKLRSVVLENSDPLAIRFDPRLPAQQLPAAAPLSHRNCRFRDPFDDSHQLTRSEGVRTNLCCTHLFLPRKCVFAAYRW